MRTPRRTGDLHKFSPSFDPVDRPKHYAESGLQPVAAIRAWGLDFFTGNAVKYIARAGKKVGESELTDLRKARWYLDDKIKELEVREALGLGKKS